VAELVIYKLIKMLSVYVCLDVNQGGTSRRRWAQRVTVLYAKTC